MKSVKILIVFASIFFLLSQKSFSAQTQENSTTVKKKSHQAKRITPLSKAQSVKETSAQRWKSVTIMAEGSNDGTAH